MTALPVIQTRDQLLSMLAEAAELEHNLMCLYLYAVFSLKTDPEEGLSEAEIELVKSWRNVIMGVCVQEMSHLALVSNLATAVGGNAHMFRSNFPIQSGYFPADFVIELSPFDRDTLDHFIFLERSSDSDVEDSLESEGEDYTRGAPRNRLMTHGGDYSTVGELYECIKNGIVHLSEKLGSEKLFCGDKRLQLTTEDVSIEGMDVICDVTTALKAIDRIVEEGEGGSGGDESHFQKFCTVRREYEEALAKNPNFSPARPCAKNPVMRKPATDQSVVWINHPEAAPVIDLVNALYDLMVRSLTLLYSGENRPKADREALLALTFDLMKCLAQSAGHLSRLKANTDYPDLTAGASFATNRHFLPPLIRNEKMVLAERIEEILSKLGAIPGPLQKRLRETLEGHYNRLR